MNAATIYKIAVREHIPNTVAGALFDAEPILKMHLIMAAKSARDYRLAGDRELYAETIDEIDSITDRLAERGQCRPRKDMTRLGAERARLKYRGRGVSA